jgi:hypothetical protein
MFAAKHIDLYLDGVYDDEGRRRRRRKPYPSLTPEEYQEEERRAFHRLYHRPAANTGGVR